uniref:Uncharacterized protein n=1 Tax=Glossina pallidipes TaxID=7398 RepID=A0A1B0A8C5_GLOPL
MAIVVCFTSRRFAKFSYKRKPALKQMDSFYQYQDPTSEYFGARCCCLLLSEASEAISVFSSLLSFDDDDDDDDDDVNVASRREFSKLRAPIEKKLSNHCLSSSLNSDATDVDDVSISSSEISCGDAVVVSISFGDSLEVTLSLSS